ncbi:RNA polymerase sigma factor [Pseudoprevotella muciniphila]|uniref:RNA polymerase sigma factor n=1 Tax=Pseudoprevotella muciniphila TaxID=2133944 RepID=A0A5P8E966_9BACT|nr:RNA polymerase sigma factor [Pseudoprevotella muciniphila]MBQ7664205.1 RNA polymerase sigma factor [Bacteroidaceae bacterium]QFQ13506.1 RNA polymerase sigma factor [Pseudoprevotella muciniphila]
MDNLKKLTDDQLVELYVQSNNEAFDELLARYKDKLYSYIFFNVHNEDMANDIFQETFVRAIITIQQGRYTAAGKFQAWITRIARNQIIDQFRLNKSENTISNDDCEGDIFNDVRISVQPVENQMLTEQMLEEACQLMDELPMNQREVVYMRFFQGLSFKEIAETTGVSINTALGRMRYAILNMRKMADERCIAL